MPPKKKARVSKTSAKSGKIDDIERTSSAGRKRKAAAPVEKTEEGSQSAGSAIFTCWLMKSEPESRFENGIDVKFGIEDLKALPDQTGCWDGVRNYQARNFMRQMKEGQQAFFYHSNCKEPGIAGIMRHHIFWTPPAQWNMVMAASCCWNAFLHEGQGSCSDLMEDGSKYRVILRENMLEAARPDGLNTNCEGSLCGPHSV
ncbi:hypothetical protein ILYODFUR_010009 [Ilyodon furcidens]|uniref:Thymocyte nuclear protein 1 n=1 Tax=Ilyodon furcidens TaxID=33524 RepID=A0ABV0TTP1_9TELE